jgi:hypothetical protein
VKPSFFELTFPPLLEFVLFIPLLLMNNLPLGPTVLPAKTEAIIFFAGNKEQFQETVVVYGGPYRQIFYGFEVFLEAADPLAEFVDLQLGFHAFYLVEFLLLGQIFRQSAPRKLLCH